MADRQKGYVGLLNNISHKSTTGARKFDMATHCAACGHLVWPDHATQHVLKPHSKEDCEATRSDTTAESWHPLTRFMPIRRTLIQGICAHTNN